MYRSSATTRVACAFACVWLVLLASCSVRPHWVAVAGGADGNVLRFDFELQRADTIRVALPAGRAQAISHVAFTQGGAGLFLRVAGGDEFDAIERVRLATGERADGWSNARGFQTTAWLPLPDAATVLAAGTARTPPGDPPGYLWFLAADAAWRERRIEACAGVPVAISQFIEIDRAFLVCGTTSATVVAVDTKLERVTRTSSAGLSECDPSDLDISRTGGILFVACRTSGKLVYLDRFTLQPLDSVAIGPGVGHVAVSSRHPQAVALRPDRAEVVLVDLQGRAVRARIGTGATPLDLALTGDGRWAFIVTDGGEPGGGSLIKLDVESGQVTAVRQVPPGTRTVTSWPGARSPVMRWR